MSKRYDEFQEAMVPRAIELENLYGMRFLNDLEKARRSPKIAGTSTIALVLFLLLAVLWAFFIISSFTF